MRCTDGAGGVHEASGAGFSHLLQLAVREGFNESRFSKFPRIVSLGEMSEFVAAAPVSNAQFPLMDLLGQRVHPINSITCIPRRRQKRI